MPKTKKPCKAVWITERDLKRLDDDVEKCALRLGERFGETDMTLVRLADDLLRDVRDWANQVREYMTERAAEGETWQL